MLDAPHGEHEALQRLCAHFGIATDYHDIFGNRHVIAPANLVTLLESFGVDPHALPHESLEQVDAAHWLTRALAPAAPNLVLGHHGGGSAFGQAGIYKGNQLT